MGKPIPFDVRAKIVRDFQSGQSHQSIADAINYSREGVKKVIRRHRERGEAALKPDYSRCGKTPRKHFSAEMEAEITRRRLGLAGAPDVYSVLRELHPDVRVPSVSAIQLRWKRDGGRPRTAKQPRQPANTWTKEVHHTWQIDGKEQVAIGNDEQVSWGNIADEASSTALYSGVFPHRTMAQVPEQAMCQAVNHCFEKEGLPKRIKIDNGLPLVHPHERDLPTRTVLWWIGLGIEVVYNKPRCPQQNGTVENLQGTCFRWSNPSGCQSAEMLQLSLNEANRIQRCVFRLRKKQGKTRQELYPQLDTNPRKFTREAFDYGLVKHYLAQKVWQRTVPKCGTICFANAKIYVSNKLAGQTVTVTFDPIEAEWIVRNVDGSLLKTSPKEIFSERLILEIANMSKN